MRQYPSVGYMGILGISEAFGVDRDGVVICLKARAKRVVIYGEVYVIRYEEWRVKKAVQTPTSGYYMLHSSSQPAESKKHNNTSTSIDARPPSREIRLTIINQILKILIIKKPPSPLLIDQPTPLLPHRHSLRALLILQLLKLLLRLNFLLTHTNMLRVLWRSADARPGWNVRCQHRLKR